MGGGVPRVASAPPGEPSLSGGERGQVARAPLVIGLVMALAGIVLAADQSSGIQNAVGASPVGIIAVLMVALGGLVMSTSWSFAARNRRGLLTAAALAVYLIIVALWLLLPEPRPPLDDLPLGVVLNVVLGYAGLMLLILVAVMTVFVGPLLLLIGWLRERRSRREATSRL